MRRLACLAEARAGQVIKEMQKEGKLAKAGDNPKKRLSQESTISLPDLQITRDESSRYKKAASVLEADPTWFDRAMAEATDAGQFPVGSRKRAWHSSPKAFPRLGWQIICDWLATRPERC